MPTPRHFSEIAKQVRVRASSNNPNDWLSGVVVSSTGFINASFQVALDGGGTVNASSAIDAPITEGSLVWVIKTGSSGLIVGVQ